MKRSKLVWTAVLGAFAVMCGCMTAGCSQDGADNEPSGGNGSDVAEEGKKDLLEGGWRVIRYEDGRCVLEKYEGTEYNVTVPSDVTIIGEAAFSESRIGEVTIPEGVTSIRKSAFSGCNNLSRVRIPASMTSIWEDAFTRVGDRYNRWEVIYNGTKADWYNKILFGNKVLSPWNIITPCLDYCTIFGKDGSGWFQEEEDIIWFGEDGVLTKYKGDEADVAIPWDITGIGGNAFLGCRNLTKVEIPETVTRIEYSAFENCSNLESVAIPVSVTYIGLAAFSRCEKLAAVEYAGTLAQWCAMHTDWSLFKYEESVRLSDGTDLKKAKTLSIPEGVTRINAYAFYNCSNLESVEIPEGVTSIGESAFSECTSLKNVELPEGVTRISNAFSRCSNLESVTIPSTVYEIYTQFYYNYDEFKYKGSCDSAFSECENLTAVQYNGTLAQWCAMSNDPCLLNAESVKLADGTDLKRMKDLIIPNGVTSIGSYAFFGCSNLESVTIPEGVTDIGESAFDGCDKLVSVNISDSVGVIGAYSFCKCSSLASVKIPFSVTSIESYAFSSCDSLANVVYGGRQVDWNNEVYFGTDTGLNGRTITGTDGLWEHTKG